MSKPLKPILLTGAAALVIAGVITVATTSTQLSAGGMTEDKVKEIVKQYIADNPSEIIASLQNWQRTEESNRVKKQQEAASKMQDKIGELTHAGMAGNPDGDVTIVEFFDYNCGACKMMFESIDAIVKEDKNVKVLFVEYPIFGPQSEENAKIGAAVVELAPEKYFAFHTAMMRNQNKSDAAYAYDVAKNLGIDVDKLKEEAAKEKYTELLAKDRALGGELGIQGTPAVVIGDLFLGGAVRTEELKGHVMAQRNKVKK